MKYFFLFLISIASCASLIAMHPDEKQEEGRLRRNSHLIENLLAGLEKKEQEQAQQQRDAQAQRDSEIRSSDAPWQLGVNAHVRDQQTPRIKSALEIGLEVASSKDWAIGVTKDLEEVKKEYENEIKSLKNALSLMYPTDNIQRRLKKLDNPAMKDIWSEHAAFILACAHTETINLEEALRKDIKGGVDFSGVKGNYQNAYANKLLVERFDAQKMREWFGCALCKGIQP